MNKILRTNFVCHWHKKEELKIKKEEQINESKGFKCL